MHSQTIFIQQQRLLLDPAQLIQSGGEGMVFGIGDTAVKLYHQPQSHHITKLQHMLTTGLQHRLPPAVYAPIALVQDTSGQTIGFQMPRLPAQAAAARRLATATFWPQNALTTPAVLSLFQTLHTTLHTMHQTGVIIGDLNDQNLHFTRQANTLTPHLIDADSYQFSHFPCPVAMLSFLDPQLYGVADFRQRPYFTPLTDWYAFFVLLVKSLLLVHPYGGAHHQHKSLQSRAAHGISILHPHVTYPKNARPLDTLSDDLLHHLHHTFNQGQRLIFPPHLLAHYAADLTTCPHCGLSYPRQRPGCPACRRPTPAPLAPDGLRELWAGEGVIEQVAIWRNGRILLILRRDNQYTLLRLGIGGTIEETPLFSGRPGYRFALFDEQYLAVNPPQGRQLLLLNISHQPPRRLTLLETANFRETAVFAATPTHLYRIAGTWIMRGQIRDGLYVEDAIATAHRDQTYFAASPYGQTLAGYHRIFAETRFFLWHEGAAYDVPLPPLAPGESGIETAVTFGPTPENLAAFGRKIRHGRDLRTELFVVNQRGQITSTITDSGEAWQPQQFPYTLDRKRPCPPFHHLPPHFPLPDEAILHHHPQGVVVQHISQLQFSR